MRVAHFIGVVALSLVLISFQNCGPAFKSMSAESLDISSLGIEKSCAVQNGVGEWDDEGSESRTCVVNSCNLGFKNIANACTPSPTSCPIANGNGEFDTSGTCRITGCNTSFHVNAEQTACEADRLSCAVMNGLGERVWDGAQYGACQVVSCISGYTRAGNACIQNSISCPIMFGTGILQPDGSCRVDKCNSGYHIRGAVCEGDVIACSIDNGTGTQTWSGTAYGACMVKTCNTNYQKRLNYCVPIPPNPAYVGPATGLRTLGAARGVLMGTAVNSTALVTEGIYARTLYENYNYLVAENDMKFETVQPKQGQFDFRKGDALVEFAIKYNAKVRGHAFVWHTQNPAWLTNGNFTPAQKLNIMQTHIQTVMKHYKDKYPGQVVAWDVVNESFDGLTANYRNTIWSPIGNEEYIRKAFEYAHQADPTALLFYNDYYNETSNPKAEAIFNLISKLKSQGVPIHGVGMQVHLSSEYDPPSVADLRAMIRRYAAIGVVVEYTEFDVRTDSAGGISAVEAARAQLAYRNITQACREEAPRCRAVVTWGFTTKYSWIPSSFTGFIPALPFNLQYQPTLEFNSMRDALR